MKNLLFLAFPPNKKIFSFFDIHVDRSNSKISKKVRLKTISCESRHEIGHSEVFKGSFVWYYWTYQHANFDIYFVSFVIVKRIWCYFDDCMWLYFLLLAIWKLPVVKHIIHILCMRILITSNSLFWRQKWQNVEMCMLIHSIIPNINSMENFTMSLHLWKNWDKISHLETTRNFKFTNVVWKKCF